MAYVAESAMSYPLSFDVRGNVVMTTSQDKIWADRVFLAISTTVGERVMRPAYGISGATSLFDSQSVTEEQLQRDISSLFASEFNLLTLQEVSISFDKASATATANITYTLPNQTEATSAIGLVYINGINPPYEENL
jgi:phage baseplate assembly protein W